MGNKSSKKQEEKKPVKTDKFAKDIEILYLNPGEITELPTIASQWELLEVLLLLFFMLKKAIKKSNILKKQN